MQVALPEVLVTRVKFFGNEVMRITYGPYMTTCTPSEVWSVKKQMKELPVICPTCKKRI